MSMGSQKNWTRLSNEWLTNDKEKGGMNCNLIKPENQQNIVNMLSVGRTKVSVTNYH